MTDFEEYIDQYGCHFSKKLYEWAVSMMTDRSGNNVTPMTKEQIEEWMKMQGVTVKNNKGYDVPYVYHMLKSDGWGSSITTDKQLALAVVDFQDDKDGNPCKAFDHFVVDCRAKKEPIFWDTVM